MKEHAVLIPTTLGPVGGIVNEPPSARRGALILLQGLGAPCRAGVNSNWTLLARDLSGLGLVVLRFDLACEGDSTLAGREVERVERWRRNADLAILREVAPWFLGRADEHELLLVGSCHGGRVALEFAASDSVARGLFLVTPYLSSREPAMRDAPKGSAGPPPEPAWANGPTLNSEDELVEGFRACQARGPVWVLAGDGEVEEALPFARRLEKTGPSFELEHVPGMPLHPVGHPQQQSTVRRRLLDRVALALVERGEAALSSQ